MSDVTDRQPADEASERRGELRVPAATLGDVSSRLIGGGVLTLVNYTSRGLYGQSPSRLLVGSRISVRLATATLNAVVTGRVVRSSLTDLIGGVPRYEVAVHLERDVDWTGGASPTVVAEVELEPEPQSEAAVEEAYREAADGTASR